MQLDDTFGQGQPEAKAVLAASGDHEVYSFIAGLGGREIRPASAESVFRGILDGEADPHGLNWVDVRQ